MLQWIEISCGSIQLGLICLESNEWKFASHWSHLNQIYTLATKVPHWDISFKKLINSKLEWTETSQFPSNQQHLNQIFNSEIQFPQSWTNRNQPISFVLAPLEPNHLQTKFYYWIKGNQLISSGLATPRPAYRSMWKRQLKTWCPIDLLIHSFIYKRSFCVHAKQNRLQVAVAVEYSVMCWLAWRRSHGVLWASFATVCSTRHLLRWAFHQLPNTKTTPEAWRIYYS